MEQLSINQLLKAFREKKVSPVEITELFLERALEINKKYNAFIRLLPEQAMAQAGIAEKRILAGEDSGLLLGIPVAFKDNIDTRGIITTNGSAIDRNRTPEENAFVVKQLLGAGAINIGKNHLHEYALGVTSYNPHYGPALNPWDTEYSPGGSSGGSAIAAATMMCLGAIGTDTGGSIRVPASACGVVGLKPTYGLVSTKGISINSWTIDHTGPIAGTVDDLSILMDALMGREDHLFQKQSAYGIKGMRIGIPVNYFNEKVDPRVYDLFQTAAQKLKFLGATLIEVAVPGMDETAEANFNISFPEIGYVHRERIAKHFAKYGPDVQEIMGTSSTSPASAYIAALKKKEEVTHAVDDLFNTIEVLITPTMPILPQKFDVEEITIDDIKEPLFDCVIRYAGCFNLTGHPALSIPCGMAEGLPVGLQLVGPCYQEHLLFRAGHAYEKAALQDFYKLRDKKLGFNFFNK
ncbi:MAG: amidase [Firmicutes bacterium]|nr:amidase [Bacillota bacterium]